MHLPQEMHTLWRATLVLGIYAWLGIVTDAIEYSGPLRANYPKEPIRCFPIASLPSTSTTPCSAPINLSAPKTPARFVP